MDNNRIELTVFLYNQKLAEQLNITLSDDHDVEARLSVKIDHVASVREIAMLDEDAIRTDRCLLEFKNDNSMQVKGSYNEIISKLEALGW